VARHFVENRGDLSGAVLKAIALKNNCGFYRLSREQLGIGGSSASLVEHLCAVTPTR